VTLRSAFLLLLALATPAAAQSHNELSVLVGTASSAEIERKAPAIESLELASGFPVWHVSAARFFSPRFGVEISFAEQDAALELGSRGETAELYDVTLQQAHLNAVYAFAAESRRLTPFVFAGLGLTFLDASEVPGETKFSWDVGAGAKFFPGRTFGARAQVRYAPTLVNDDGAESCSPIGFCESSFRQFEFTGGLSIRF
jgi:opacity protein-like surface antigen